MAVLDLETAYKKGFDLRCEGRYAEAKAEFEKVLSVDPGHVASRHQLALVLNFEGDFDGSLAALSALAIEQPANLTVQYDLAMTEMMLGMYEDACARFRYILSVKPEHEDTKRQIIYC